MSFSFLVSTKKKSGGQYVKFLTLGSSDDGIIIIYQWGIHFWCKISGNVWNCLKADCGGILESALTSH